MKWKNSEIELYFCFAGKIEFENLELRPDLLQKLGVPGYSLRAGHIGKLLVHISPWHYATEPGNVTIDGIYLLIVPSHAIKVDKKTKAENKVQDKLRTLSKIEEMRAQKLNDDPSDSQSQKESKDGFILRQVMAIVRNLQISISNIHIRLEDASTDPTCKVSLGLSLDSLTLNTCSSNWEERLVTESSDVFFKVHFFIGFPSTGQDFFLQKNEARPCTPAKCLFWDCCSELG